MGEMANEREDYLQPTYPKWDELRFDMSKSELLDIVDLMIEEPKAYDILKQWIIDNCEAE
jgi:hypothetical protein